MAGQIRVTRAPENQFCDTDGHESLPAFANIATTMEVEIPGEPMGVQVYDLLGLCRECADELWNQLGDLKPDESAPIGG